MTRLALPVALLASLLVPAGACAADLQAAPGSLAGVFGSAQAGDVIHLAAGDYGTFNGGSKPGPVRIIADAGIAAKLEANLTASQNVTLDGLTINGGYLNGARNVQIVNSHFTAALRVDTPTSTPNANILIDHNTFNGINVCGTCYEGRLAVRGYNNNQPSGVTISNNLFSGGGDSDGVQIIGNAYGVQVGPGNEFTGLTQTSSGAHTDPIQLYGSSHTVITGNYIHGNSTGIMAPDGSEAETITQNVIQTSGYPWPIVMGAAEGNVVSHNTLPGAGGAVEVDKSNAGAPSTGVVVRDNVLASIVSATGAKPTGVTEDYNLFSAGSGAAGAHSLRAKPTYAGGTAPSTYDGFRLTAASKGAKAADDGTDVGITGTLGNPPAISPLTPTPPGATPGPGAGSGGSSGTGAGDATVSLAVDSAKPLAMTLRNPTVGSVFVTRLSFKALASAPLRVNRIEFWVDGRRVASDKTVPFGYVWHPAGKLSYTFHTASARAFDVNGQVSSLGVVVRRVHRVRTALALRRVAGHWNWRLAATTSSSGTLLSGRGVAGQSVHVSLSRCSSHTGRIALRTTLRADKHGKLHATRKTPGLCVARLHPTHVG